MQTLFALDPTACGPGTLRIGDPTVCPAPPPPPPTGPPQTPPLTGRWPYRDFAEGFAYEDAEGSWRITTDLGELAALAAKAEGGLIVAVSTSEMLVELSTSPLDIAIETSPMLVGVDTSFLLIRVETEPSR